MSLFFSSPLHVNMNFTKTYVALVLFRVNFSQKQNNQNKKHDIFFSTKGQFSHLDKGLVKKYCMIRQFWFICLAVGLKPLWVLPFAIEIRFATVCSRAAMAAMASMLRKAVVGCARQLPRCMIARRRSTTSGFAAVDSILLRSLRDHYEEVAKMTPPPVSSKLSLHFCFITVILNCFVNAMFMIHMFIKQHSCCVF